MVAHVSALAASSSFIFAVLGPCCPCNKSIVFTLLLVNYVNYRLGHVYLASWDKELMHSQTESSVVFSGRGTLLIPWAISEGNGRRCRRDEVRGGASLLVTEALDGVRALGEGGG